MEDKEVFRGDDDHVTVRHFNEDMSRGAASPSALEHDVDHVDLKFRAVAQFAPCDIRVPEPPLGILNPNCHVACGLEHHPLTIVDCCTQALCSLGVDIQPDTDFRIGCVAYPKYNQVVFEVSIYREEKKLVVEVQRH